MLLNKAKKKKKDEKTKQKTDESKANKDALQVRSDERFPRIHEYRCDSGAECKLFIEVRRCECVCVWKKRIFSEDMLNSPFET